MDYHIRIIQTYFEVQIHSFCFVCSHLLKYLERQIFRNGGSNILGVYQNKSDFFQVCEVLLFYYFGSVATHGHIASKRKRLSAFASQPHMPGNRKYNTTRPARHIAQGRRVAQHFHFHVGPPLSKPTIGKPHPARRRVGKQKRGEDLAVAWKARNLVSDGAR